MTKIEFAAQELDLVLHRGKHRQVVGFDEHVAGAVELREQFQGFLEFTSHLSGRIRIRGQNHFKRSVSFDDAVMPDQQTGSHNGVTV